MKQRFADIHCHPHARAFHWMRHTKNERKFKDRFQAWNVVLSNFNKQEKGKRAFSYSQCDPVKLWNGETKLVYASLYPFEKGFYKGGELEQSKVVKLIELMSASGLGLFNPIKFGKFIFSFITGERRTLKILRVLLQSVLMRMPLRRIKYFLSNDYDYYDELIRERDFLLKMTGVKTRNRIYIPGWFKNITKSARKLRRKYPDSLDAVGTYTTCKNFAEVETTINDNNIAMVLTIEGLHSLGTDNALDKVEDRIKEMKTWEFPVFFVTIAHHFNNYLCGHAHSLPNAGKVLFDQSEGMNGDFNDKGERAIKLLLSLDNNLDRDPSLGHRILPDLKHTSIQSRKWYYDKIVGPCLDKGDVIPVILSHVGYSGWPTIQESIDYSPNEDDKELIDGFYPWNINACGEDAIWAAKTGGLVGLSFDQRILGDRHDKQNSIDLIFTNLIAMIDQIVKSPDLTSDQKKNCWTYFTIGTDFEGYIDPTKDYSNVLEFDDFEKDLASRISQMSDSDKAKYHLSSEADIRTAVEGICFENAYEFLRRNF